MESIKNLEKQVAEVKKEAVKLAKELADIITALKPLGLADAILNDSEFKNSLLVFNPVPVTPALPHRTVGEGARELEKRVLPKWTPPEATTAKPVAKNGLLKKGERGYQKQQVLQALAGQEEGLTSGEVGKAINYEGDNISAVMAAIFKDGKGPIKKIGSKWVLVQK